jgi:hypothetical protein
MNRFAIAVTAAAAGAASLGVSAGTSAGEACVEGQRMAGNAKLITWCGPATAKLKAGGKLYTFRGGRCRTSFGVFLVSIGTKTVDGPPRSRYFGLGIPAKRDGTYDAFLQIDFQTNGKEYSLLNERVTIAGNMTRGTFTGSLDGARATGSFRC